MDIQEFCQELPKIELHAHLNGSLSKNTLKLLGCLDEGVDEYCSLNNILDKTRRTLDECFVLFKVAHKATKNIESVYTATTCVIEEFYADNVVYLELRTTPRAEIGMTKREYVEAVVKAVQDNKNLIKVKVILSIDRRYDKESSYETLEMIAHMKQKYSDIIVGVDLCGNPSEGFFDKHLFEYARKQGLYVTLHCGEVKNDNETAEMLDFKPDRIGHATCVHTEYGGSLDLWNIYLKHKIPIEACLTSNVLCGTSSSYKSHHLKEWINNSLPFTLGTDDKGVFCTTLSEEYYQAAKSFNLNKKDLWKISYNSVDYSFCSPGEKQELQINLEKWRRSKDNF